MFLRKYAKVFRGTYREIIKAFFNFFEPKVRKMKQIANFNLQICLKTSTRGDFEISKISKMGNYILRRPRRKIEAGFKAKLARCAGFLRKTDAKSTARWFVQNSPKGEL